jgi:hypothetical protein
MGDLAGDAHVRLGGGRDRDVVAHAKGREVLLEDRELHPEVADVGHLERRVGRVDGLPRREVPGDHVAGDRRAYDEDPEATGASAVRAHTLVRRRQRGLAGHELGLGDLGLAGRREAATEQIPLSLRVDVGGVERGFGLEHPRTGPRRARRSRSRRARPRL